METLLQIAKRLGIKPNPYMTEEEFEKIQTKIRHEFGGEYWNSLADALYRKRKKFPQVWNEKAVEQNIIFLKSMTPKGIRVHDQYDGKVALDKDATFIWHSARQKGEDYMERFAVSIQMDHPNFPVLCHNLDAFIKKHHASFKMTDFHHIQRTDTLNVYMTRPITPEIAKELYGVVRPFLKQQNHEYLDGFSMKAGGREIKGIKYGPEPLLWSEVMKMGLHSNIAKSIKNRLTELPKQFNYSWTEVREAESLGLASANVQYLDLLYYLAGKEGQNPFQLGNLYGLPLNAGFPLRVARKYTDKKIDIMDVGHTAAKPVVSTANVGNLTTPTSPARQPVSPSVAQSSSEKEPTDLGMRDLLKELQLLRDEVQSMHSEISRFRQENAQLGKMFTELRRENTQLQERNKLLRARVQAAFPSGTKRTPSGYVRN